MSIGKYMKDKVAESGGNRTGGDIADQGNAAAETFLDAALSKRMPEGPWPNGRCHNCGEAVVGGNRWCDAECRNDWEQQQ